MGEIQANPTESAFLSFQLIFSIKKNGMLRALLHLQTHDVANTFPVCLKDKFLHEAKLLFRF